MRMNIGNEIVKWRRAFSMTQEAFAAELGVTPREVSDWECGKTLPDVGKIKQISKTIGISIGVLMREESSPQSFEWDVKGVQFSEDRMFARIKTAAEHNGLLQTYQALYYAKLAHSGQLRKKQKFSCERPNYIVHPLEMTCHLQSMHIEEDEMLAVSLLHDVCEDCSVTPEELPFSDTVRHSVMLLTKHKDPALTKEEMNIRYYDGISHDRIASIVKLIDRCNNVSTMALAYSNEKLDEYIVETEAFVMPLLKAVKKSWPEYMDLTFLVEYQLVAVMESVKVMLMTAQQ